jgi:hypothetical protein
MFCFAASLSAAAQGTTADKYLITAKAGGVNLVEGDVNIYKVDGRSTHLVKGDEVQIGEKVTTGSDGRAEILMNPGSYIRIGANSSFEFASTDLDDVRLKVYKGSAILEVFGTDGFQIDLSSDTARFTILQTGVYRIDTAPNGTSTVAVWRGKLRAGLDSSQNVNAGKVVAFDGMSYTVTKFDREDRDSFALWSKDRSKELSKISLTLRPERLRDPLINSYYGGRWDLFRSFGLWVFDPFHRSYCFLPFGYGWSSPYGYGFGRSIWYYNLPVAIYNQSAPPVSNSGGINTQPRRAVSTPGRTQGTGAASDSEIQKRQVRGTLRDIVRQDRTYEPRVSVPRIEPVVPSAPVSQPSKRVRGN